MDVKWHHFLFIFHFVFPFMCMITWGRFHITSIFYVFNLFWQQRIILWVNLKKKYESKWVWQCKNAHLASYILFILLCFANFLLSISYIDFSLSLSVVQQQISSRYVVFHIYENPHLPCSFIMLLPLADPMAMVKDKCRGNE